MFDQKSVIQLATGIYPEERKTYRNPFRKDEHPNCYFKWRKGYLRLIDWACWKYHYMNCWDMLMERYQCTFDAAVKLAREKVGGLRQAAPPPEVEVDIQIRDIQRADWNYEAILYWLKRGIKVSQLEDDGVYPISGFKINSSKQPSYFRYHPVDFGFVIPLNSGSKKVYQPHFKVPYYTDGNNSDLYMEDGSSGDLLILTKGYKECRIMKNYGYKVMGVMSESAKLPVTKLEDLANRFKRIIVSYDGDDMGDKNLYQFSKRIQDLGIPHYEFKPFPTDLRNLGKDWDDLYVKAGHFKTKKWLKSYLTSTPVLSPA
jgi:hypothetical protein